MRCICSLLVVSLLLFASVSQGGDARDSERTRSDFESLAAELPYLSLGSVLYDRPDSPLHVPDPAIRKENARILERVTDGRDASEALLDLLVHREPKVRTLAAVALFDREDPAVLPALAKLHADEAATFMDYPRNFGGPLEMKREVGPPNGT